MEAALVTVEKVIERKKIRTTVSLTDRGRSAVEVYWKTMDKIRKQSRS